ncbi:unnamed protein product [Nippostrongylus brasiliensis]|uniref:BEACH domain-containing protein n=1 Tax=Nippostrongylus brasiliensis TaxID=27835 RepID=A0A0N4XFQ0_NIPBR|nr:unnamed protein product [Nippostrongylus brasiliensis]
MKSDVWNENAFKELLIPAVVGFTSNDCSDVERKTLLGATVVLRKLPSTFSFSSEATTTTNEQTCDDRWKDIASRFGACYARLEGVLNLIQNFSKATSKWVNGAMSNYDYILELNKAAGRVRGEVHNHPVFPWVCDFKEANGGWRDLSKTKYRLTKGDDQLGFVQVWRFFLDSTEAVLIRNI